MIIFSLHNIMGILMHQRLSWELLGPLWIYLEPVLSLSCEVLGCLGGMSFGPVLGCFGLVVGYLKVLEGARACSRGVQGLSAAILGLSQEVVGMSWVCLGPSWACLGLS